MDKFDNASQGFKCTYNWYWPPDPTLGRWHTTSPPMTFGQLHRSTYKTTVFCFLLFSSLPPCGMCSAANYNTQCNIHKPEIRRHTLWAIAAVYVICPHAAAATAHLSKASDHCRGVRAWNDQNKCDHETLEFERCCAPSSFSPWLQVHWPSEEEFWTLLPHFQNRL